MRLMGLCYFDKKQGPMVLDIVPDVPDNLTLSHISLLMDFYEEGFFSHEFGEVKTANLLFSIPSPMARGKVDILMVSVITWREDCDMTMFSDILEIFRNEFLKIEKAYEAFNPESKNNEERRKEIKIFIEDFFQALPKERITIAPKSSKLLFFGLPQSGITTVIEALNKNYFSPNTMEKEVNVIKNLFGNLSIISYNFSERKNFHKILPVYLKDMNGLVFVLDTSDVSKLEDARKELHTINSFPEAHNLPLLILLNKMDLETPEINNLIKTLKLDEMKTKSIKYCKIKALENKGITKAFNWLAVEISNEMLRSPDKFFK